MNDILPEQTPLWRYFEGTVASLLDGYGYRQIRMAIVEFTELFKRSIGEVTDIVEKEMYTFDDRNGDSLTDRKSTRLNSSHSQISYAVFFFNDTATTEIYTLSLHDALPICSSVPSAKSPISSKRRCTPSTTAMATP